MGKTDFTFTVRDNISSLGADTAAAVFVQFLLIVYHFIDDIDLPLSHKAVCRSCLLSLLSAGP